MRVQLARWGNSTGVRLPARMIDALGLGPGSQVEVKVEGGVIELRPVRQTSRQLLEELVAEARRLGPGEEPETLDWGPDRGSEIIDDAYSRGEITLGDIQSGRATHRR